MNNLTAVEKSAKKIEELILEYKQKLSSCDANLLTKQRNHQNRNIKQILGHLIDSANNNHQRIVRLQYQKRLSFPDYQSDNDTWIQIQNYENQDWHSLLALWEHYCLHMAFIIRQVKEQDLDNLWTDGFIKPVSLFEIIIGFPEHMELHLKEIRLLMHSE